MTQFLSEILCNYWNCLEVSEGKYNSTAYYDRWVYGYFF